MNSLSVLYDGWPVVYAPDSPAALHLLALLECLPAEVHAVVALPGEPPEWFPEEIATCVELRSSSSRARLDWEQRLLRRLVKRLGVQLLHFTSPVAPLFRPPLSVISPAGYGEEDTQAGFLPHLREAAALGGLARTRFLLWPDDLPTPASLVPLVRLPPLVHPAFTGGSEVKAAAGLLHPDLPEACVLYHGPTSPWTLNKLLNLWSWVADSTGTYYPLGVIGLAGESQQYFLRLLEESGLGESVRVLPALSPLELSELYRRSAALIHPTRLSPWGDPVRHALACEVPVVAEADPLVEALVGPSAYLAPVGDVRALAAALISVTMVESLAESLREAAHRRASTWDCQVFGSALFNVYQQLVG